MSDEDSYKDVPGLEATEVDAREFTDQQIDCIDCSEHFPWTVGEQEFFRDKGLKHAPKRCKSCKKAKNERIESILKSEEAGKRKIEVSVVCDTCSMETTVPFYPSQGRPVLCRSCFLSKQKG